MNEDNLYPNTTSKIPTSSTGYSSDKSFSGGHTPYVMPRQTGTGLTRGVQTVSGYIQITDPNNGNVIMIMGFVPGGF